MTTIDPAAPRTFAAGMRGDDVRGWQRTLNAQLRRWNIAYRVSVDGEFGEDTARWTRRVMFGLGLASKGVTKVTPQTRIAVRNPRQRTPQQLEAARKRRVWLRKLRRRYAVHTPIKDIITSAHDFGPGHDGIDLICHPNAKIYAVCRAKVIDVRAGGWWGNRPTGDVTRGDGIIQLEALETIGPLKKGMHIGYGHAEHARVRVGETVQAGEMLGRAGFANAWHIHFMLNDGSTMRGIGNLDPRPCLNLFTRPR